MKKFIIALAFVALSIGAMANPVRYFTYGQVTRAVNYINAQNEIMVYCGYEYEIETYVLLNEVWAERVNSQYYELWVYGYDAYTGEEVYMPLDLSCVWLLSGHNIYNAATYLRFRNTSVRPNIYWTVPPYNPFTRHPHLPGFVRTYHYDVHIYGWMPPAPGMNPGPGHHYYHPYYMRNPYIPVYYGNTPWTPGVGAPHVSHNQNDFINPRATAGHGSQNGANSTASGIGYSSYSRPSNDGGHNGASPSGMGSTSPSNGRTSGTTGNGNGRASGTTGNSRATDATGNTGRSTGSSESTGRSTGTTGNSRATTTTTTTTRSTSPAATTTTRTTTPSSSTSTRSSSTTTRSSSSTTTTTTTRSTGSSSSTRGTGSTSNTRGTGTSSSSTRSTGSTSNTRSTGNTTTSSSSTTSRNASTTGRR